MSGKVPTDLSTEPLLLGSRHSCICLSVGDVNDDSRIVHLKRLLIVGATFGISRSIYAFSLQYFDLCDERWKTARLLRLRSQSTRHKLDLLSEIVSRTTISSKSKTSQVNMI